MAVQKKEGKAEKVVDVARAAELSRRSVFLKPQSVVPPQPVLKAGS